MTLVIITHYYMVLFKDCVYWLGLNNTLDFKQIHKNNRNHLKVVAS